MTKWDARFLETAKLVSTWSKDPHTQVGAVIVDQDKHIIATGFNGFPKGMDDSLARYYDKEIKHRMVVHAEMNAILNCVSSVANCTLYIWRLFPCTHCAKHIIQAGIRRIVCVTHEWREEFDYALDMFEEAGIDTNVIEPQDIAA